MRDRHALATALNAISREAIRAEMTHHNPTLDAERLERHLTVIVECAGELREELRGYISAKVAERLKASGAGHGLG